MKTIEMMCTKITTGATNSLFEKKATTGNKNCYLLTGSSISKTGEVIESQLSTIEIKEGRDISRFQVQQGDVVLLAKGNSIRAAYITEQISALNVITSANFILLRPNQDNLIGEVLTAYFNSEQGQIALSAASVGAAIKNISLSNIRKLKIDVPILEKQNEIAELFHASNDVYSSTILMAEQQKIVANACIYELMKGAA